MKVSYVNIGESEAAIHRFMCSTGFRETTTGKWLTPPNSPILKGEQNNDPRRQWADE